MAVTQEVGRHLVWFHERSHKPEAAQFRALLAEAVGAGGLHTLVCWRKAPKFGQWLSEQACPPQLLLADWREAKPCLDEQESNHIFCQRTLVYAETPRQYKRACEWVAGLKLSGHKQELEVIFVPASVQEFVDAVVRFFYEGATANMGIAYAPTSASGGSEDRSEDARSEVSFGSSNKGFEQQEASQQQQHLGMSSVVGGVGAQAEMPSQMLNSHQHQRVPLHTELEFMVQESWQDSWSSSWVEAEAEMPTQTLKDQKQQQRFTPHNDNELKLMRQENLSSSWVEAEMPPQALNHVQKQILSQHNELELMVQASWQESWSSSWVEAEARSGQWPQAVMQVLLNMFPCHTRCEVERLLTIGTPDSYFD